MARILVTGATGNIGSQVIRTLTSGAHTLRVGVRNPEAAPSLLTQGVEVERLDWSDAESIDLAMKDVDRLFLLAPFEPDAQNTVEAALVSAKKAGVKHIVRVSAIGADPSTPLGREHGLGDQFVRESGISYTILQPTFFIDNVATYQMDALVRHSAFYGASNGGKMPYIATRDIAEVAGRILAEPAAHTGQTYVLTGPVAVSDAEVATALSEVSGRAIRYVDQSLDDLAAGLASQGTTPWYVDHLVGFEAWKASGGAADTTDVVERILGRPALSPVAALARYQSAL